MNDTIAAISTTLGIGAISIIRVSGNEAIKIVNSIFKGKNLTLVPSHTINYGFIINQDEIIDEVLISIMKSPRTFTKEDIVEINCHGGISTTNKILELLLLRGCRLANPGEFTKRAFLNGRIDLTQAEAVMDLINSKTDKARRVSLNQLNGNLTTIIRTFRQQLLEILANIEVNIDYPEYEDIEVVTIKDLANSIIEIREKLSEILKVSKDSKIIKNGINVAIVGKPNVGKSSILNGLLGESKAIVTNIAGTTRDIVEGNIILNGIMLNFIDTAGIRETADIVESFGVQKSIDKIADSDLVIVVLNNNEPLTLEDKKVLEFINGKKSIIVINKNDLEQKIDLSTLNIDSRTIVYTNTIDQNGLNTLKNKIKELFSLEELDQNDYVMLSTVRQVSLVEECLKILSEVEMAIKNNMPVDIIAIDIKRIWEKLGEIIGENYSEELIDQLFSQFCLGK